MLRNTLLSGSVRLFRQFASSRIVPPTSGKCAKVTATSALSGSSSSTPNPVGTTGRYSSTPVLPLFNNNQLQRILTVDELDAIIHDADAKRWLSNK